MLHSKLVLISVHALLTVSTPTVLHNNSAVKSDHLDGVDGPRNLSDDSTKREVVAVDRMAMYHTNYSTPIINGNISNYVTFFLLRMASLFAQPSLLQPLSL